ncbi:MAG TPA: DUF1670 domain-containing protein [Candidatus Syntrophoarchaeum butanivorans]|uniref:DUF1670 domain-containing protein n=1 Tax=Candidatus Syntropharchaeum butanivorans TaxID=1839936 RepID=A0A1F2P6U8_9EURY|nr:MAG: protein containing DUF1670 [Candidatus Syntrophoarchaeum butanivorans]HEC57227.1 DUF1670 domain-containing protein [Candidatus Syntrophoarchaeum butanivorans]
MQHYEYTDIERKTEHSGEAIMRYIKDCQLAKLTTSSAKLSELLD